LFQQPSPPLSSVVVLSLIQQLAFDLRTDTDLKLKWLQELMIALEIDHPAVQPHCKQILTTVRENLQGLSHAKDRKLLLHLANSLLKSLT